MLFEEVFWMSIVYRCRHCEYMVGTLMKENIDIPKLGWDQLTAEERKEMVQYGENGDILIQTICESCESALAHHPDRHELDFFIQ